MLTPSRPLVEVAVDSVAAAVTAAELGAGRLELCQSLEIGGLTPSVGLLEAVVARVTVPVVAMIRPRAGAFGYGEVELDQMVRDVAHLSAAGVAGVVVGPLTAAGTVDRAGLARLVQAARDLPVTFHRAVDEVADRAGAIDALVQEGVARVLTSGGAPTAWDGRAEIAETVRQAAGRLVVLAGVGIRGDHVVELVRATGVGEIHLSGVYPDATTMDRGFGRASAPDRARLTAVMNALATV